MPWFLLAVAVAALGLAFHAQYVRGLEPCPLCIYQRFPYAIAGGLGLVALIKPSPGLGRAAVRLAALVFAVGGAIAVYHVGVEQHWWASAVCGGEVSVNMTTDQLLSALRKPVEKSCDQVDWTFLGLSMATYNAPGSFALAGFCWAVGRRMKDAP